MLGSIFHDVLYRPLFNALIAAYVFLPGRDFGVAIIALTILVRIILHPLVARQYRSQRALQELQPKIEQIRKSVKDQQEQTRRLMALYKEEKVHPASGCLPIIIQLPVLFALYRVFIDGLRTEALAAIYTWVKSPGTVNPIAFGFLDLASPNIVLAVAAGLFQYIQSRLILPPRPTRGASAGIQGDLSAAMGVQALYVMPIITVVIAIRFPAGLALYWATTTLLGILEQVFLKRRYGSIPVPSAPRAS